MSYDLMVFEPIAGPADRLEFLKWYREQVTWSEPHNYSDPGITTAKLAAWYAEMRSEFPNMNGPDAYDLDHENVDIKVTDYSIGRSIIYATFSWETAEAAYVTARALAVKHGVGFFDVSAGDGEIWQPPEENVSRLGSTRPADRKPWWQFWH